MCAIFAILLAFSASSVHGYQHWTTIYDRVTQETDFSGYRYMIKSNRMTMLNLLYNALTVFVPENEATDNFDGDFSEALVLYHMAMQPYTLKVLALNNSLDSAHADNPPLWISVVDSGYYVNNAKVVESRSNYVAKCKRNQSLNQVLHVIDQVLDPIRHTPFRNATAYDFLEHSTTWDINLHRVSNFLTRVQYHDRENLFRRPGGHTFFIPIDDKMDEHHLQSIDSYIIEAHVVPNQILFTRPAAKDFIFETAANGDYIYIVLSLVAKNEKLYVKSHTVLGNSEHKKGEIVTEIVKANIPVANGVVHLIAQPLAVFDKELKPFPYLSTLYKITSDPNLSITYTIGRNGGINSILKRKGRLYTYFAPRNSAWRDYLGYNPQQKANILGRHVVVASGRLTMAKLVAMSKHNNRTTLESLSGPLELSVVYRDGDYYIAWDQSWIKVYRADYQCNDGVVHVIDGVFAVPRPAPPTSATPNYGFWRILKNLVT